MTAPASPPALLELARSIRAGDTTAEAATERCLAAIGERDGSINAFIIVMADAARGAARTADRELASGRDRGPLPGVPMSIKDILDIAGLPTTAASRVRRNHVAARDATVVARLREAGAVFVGKTNLHEFALGTTNEESAYGPVHHPLDPTRSPGGSSGGSAASILAGMAFASMGTDTGGSIRIPAAACGLVGLKPVFRDVPTQGVVPLSTSLDHVGPLCATVADAAAIFRVIADVPGLDAPPQTGDPRGLRLGVPRRYFLDLLDDDVARAFDETCARLAAAGVRLDDVTIPHAAEIGAVYLHVALTEAGGECQLLAEISRQAQQLHAWIVAGDRLQYLPGCVAASIIHVQDLCAQVHAIEHGGKPRMHSWQRLRFVVGRDDDGERAGVHA